MAKCNFCKREMLRAKGCAARIYMVGDKRYEPIKVGDPGDFYEGAGKNVRCGDCGALPGGYHHAWCDLEKCPVCGGQFLSCDCDVRVFKEE